MLFLQAAMAFGFFLFVFFIIFMMVGTPVFMRRTRNFFNRNGDKDIEPASKTDSALYILARFIMAVFITFAAFVLLLVLFGLFGPDITFD